MRTAQCADYFWRIVQYCIVDLKHGRPLLVRRIDVTKTSAYLFVYLMVGILATACMGEINPTPTPAVQDKSLITQQPCSPPCWQGLIPGKSSYDEVRALLKDNPLVQGNFANKNAAEVERVGFLWWWAGESQDIRRNNSLDFDKSHVLQRIEMRPNTDLTIEEVVKTYGVPTFINVAPQMSISPFSGAVEGITLQALFAENNFSIKWFEEGKVVFPMRVCPSLHTTLKSVIYLAPAQTQSQRDLWPRITSGTVSGSGDAYVHFKDGQVTIDCVELKEHN